MQVFTRRKRSVLFLAGMLLLLTWSMGLLFAKTYEGRKFFEQAYKIEKSSPDRAISLYRQALSNGLDGKMTRAARWRLFYLLKEEKRYGEAIVLSSRLGGKISRVVSDLHRDMKEYWDINDRALQSYIDGVHALHGAQKDRSYSDYFVDALRAARGNRKFRMEILERLVAAGQSSSALAVLDDGSGQATLEDRIFRADLLIRFRRYNEAEKSIRGILYSDGFLDSEQKYRTLYLYGKLHKKMGETERAIVYYRYAARYASGSEARRQISLAAYTLYRMGYRHQANALVKNLARVEDPDVFLVKNVLGYDVQRDPDSLAALREKEKWIREKARVSPSYLIRKAVDILEENR